MEFDGGMYYHGMMMEGGGMPLPPPNPNNNNFAHFEPIMSYDESEYATADVDHNYYDPEEEEEDEDGRSSTHGENGSSDSDDDARREEMSEGEEEEEENSEDDSEIHALLDDLETKFRSLVSTKVKEAELFFDDPSMFLASQLSSQSAAPPGADHHQQGQKWDSSIFLQVPKDEDEGEEEDHPHQEIQKKDAIPPEHQDHQAMKNNNYSVRNTFSLKKSYCVDFNDASTQTDLVVESGGGGGTHPPLIGSSDGTGTIKGEEADDEEEEEEALLEKARAQIAALREVNESLIARRKEWADQMKQRATADAAAQNNADEEEVMMMKEVETKIYECEEAIEAVDTVIQFKNEVVALGGQAQEPLSSRQLPGSNEARLVTQLDILSVEELRRLLCVYFAKVVELRTCSRRLEKELEVAEAANEQLGRRLVVEHRHAKEMALEHQNRIRYILSSSNPDAARDLYLRRMEDSLSAAKKKQHDLERSLTELLVRHGYLVNGADYDVKQVVRTLGIESQLAAVGAGGGTSRTGGGGGGGGSNNEPQPHHSRAAPNAKSGWSSRNKQHHHHNTHHSGLGQRRNGRQIDGHELQGMMMMQRGEGGRFFTDRERDRDRDRDRERGDRDHREHRQQPAPPQQPPTQVVHREKRRLIIQPGGGGAGGGSSSAQPHHQGDPSNYNNHRQSQPHHHRSKSHGHGYYK